MPLRQAAGQAVGGEERFEHGSGIVLRESHRLPVDQQRQFGIVGNRAVILEAPGFYREAPRGDSAILRRRVAGRIFDDRFFHGIPLCLRDAIESHAD